MAQVRHQHVPLDDIAPHVLEPLLPNRVAITSLADAPAIAGVAIWASVGSDADERIGAQISAGVWPVRLGPENSTSGKSLERIDVAGPSRLQASAVLMEFGYVAGDRSVNVRPAAAKNAGRELLPSLLAERLKR